MAGRNPSEEKIAEKLIKSDYITKEELEQVKEREKKSGIPWYRQLIQMGKVTFSVLEDILRYELHPRDLQEKHKSLGSALLEEGVITKAQLEEALKVQRRTNRLLGNILLELGYVTRNDIARVLAKQHNLEFMSIGEVKPEREALLSIPESLAKRYQVLPIFIEGDKITVLINSPQGVPKVRDLSVLLGKRIYPILTAVDNMDKEIDKWYLSLVNASDTSSQTRGLIKDKSPQEEPKMEKRENTSKVVEVRDRSELSPHLENKERAKVEESKRFEQIVKEASGTSAINMVKVILEGAVKAGATDIHLDPQEVEMRVRYRIDGILHDVMTVNQSLQNAVVSRIKILADLDITETRRPQDGHISLDIEGRELDVRVATLPTFLGERVVLRLLDQSSVLSGIGDLGLDEPDQERLKKIISKPYGMILVTGPTGSGKTTTLYALLNQKNVITESIVTLEDPVEYQIPGINQVQIDPDIGVTFANTLRAVLRQDVDTILVGEIRDVETAQIAIRAAMTGHIVFSTLHTNDAPDAINTLRNMNVPSYLISSALSAVIAQRLVRVNCEKCKVSYKPDSAILKEVGLPSNIKKLYRGEGCDYCYHTGYKGRTGIFEILEISPNIRRMIAEGATPDEISKESHLKTMADHCRDKIKAGITTPEEFLRVVRL
ncbi:MAG: ATPase, T2SS/T4P/T4SS family [Candidatus Hydrogenedentes bacterium]|nr:ATPase, T2SS/T4P/T4SS family [Candidatus Hydrogenedentota bacterium]